MMHPVRAGRLLVVLAIAASPVSAQEAGSRPCC